MSAIAQVKWPTRDDLDAMDWQSRDDYFRAVFAEIDRDPEELPDDQIVPDNADPLPPDPEIKTDPVDDE